jgi:hypothetical protein
MMALLLNPNTYLNITAERPKFVDTSLETCPNPSVSPHIIINRSLFFKFFTEYY